MSATRGNGQDDKAAANSACHDRRIYNIGFSFISGRLSDFIRTAAVVCSFLLFLYQITLTIMIAWGKCRCLALTEAILSVSDWFNVTLSGMLFAGSVIFLRIIPSAQKSAGE